MGDENAITTVEDAVAFHKATGVDALAVSIGTVHGFYKAKPKIEAERCAEIAEALPEFRSYCTAARERPRKIFKRS